DLVEATEQDLGAGPRRPLGAGISRRGRPSTRGLVGLGRHARAVYRRHAGPSTSRARVGACSVTRTLLRSAPMGTIPIRLPGGDRRYSLRTRWTRVPKSATWTS